MPDATELLDRSVEMSLGAQEGSLYTAAENRTGCLWGVPNTGRITTVMLAEIDEEQQELIADELLGSGAVRSENGSSTVYRFEQTMGIQPYAKVSTFTENLWVTSIGDIDFDPYSELAIEAVRELNDGRPS